MGWFHEAIILLRLLDIIDIELVLANTSPACNDNTSERF